MRILVLGADGYLGWPMSMFLSARGHEVVGVDNYFRRTAAMSLDVEPLIPTPNLHQRAKIWEEVSGKKIHVEIGDITDYDFLLGVFKDLNPMRLFTLQNNLRHPIQCWVTKRQGSPL